MRNSSEPSLSGVEGFSAFVNTSFTADQQSSSSSVDLFLSFNVSPLTYAGERKKKGVGVGDSLIGALTGLSLRD